jgi:hypothetical protein
MKDRRAFVVPANLPLKLYTAAVLAVVDRDSEAVALVAEAEEALQRFSGALTKERINRLNSAVAALAGPSTD